MRGAALKRFRRSVQIVFQDPDGTLDPRMRVGAALAGGAPRARHRSEGEDPGPRR